MEKKEIEQPGIDIQKMINDILSAKPEIVTINGKKRSIGWLHNGLTRKLTDIMLSEEKPWKRNVKAACCILLNRRNGFITNLLLRLWFWVYWRWMYYVVDMDQVEVLGVLNASKKKIQSEPFAMATILATAMMDTMMTMSRHEYTQAGQGGEPHTP
jgi:hypothetical protein